MVKDEYPEGEVFCPICQKQLITEDDKERGYHYHCEKCGEIYLNLTALEYCFSPNESMPELLKQYHELSGFKVTGK